MFSTYISGTLWLQLINGCHWKINLRIFWNLIMKNIRLKHDQCNSIILPLIIFWRILYFWCVLESILKFIIELHVLQCLFVSESNKKRGGIGIFNVSQKDIPFHFLWQTGLSLPQKGLPLPFSLAKKKIYLDTQLIVGLTDLFWKLPEFSREGIGWYTFL